MNLSKFNWSKVDQQTRDLLFGYSKESKKKHNISYAIPQSIIAIIFLYFEYLNIKFVLGRIQPHAKLMCCSRIAQHKPGLFTYSIIYGSHQILLKNDYDSSNNDGCNIFTWKIKFNQLNGDCTIGFVHVRAPPLEFDKWDERGNTEWLYHNTATPWLLKIDTDKATKINIKQGDIVSITLNTKKWRIYCCINDSNHEKAYRIYKPSPFDISYRLKIKLNHDYDEVECVDFNQE